MTKAKTAPPRSPEQVAAEFERRGESVAAWAREHGFPRSLVYQVVRGELRCHRGQSHKIAVLLGMKDGVIVS